VDLSLTTRLPGLTISLENLQVELYLGDHPGITGLHCDVAGGLGHGSISSEGDGSGGSKRGTWTFDPKQHVLRWVIGLADSSGSTYTMKASWSVGSNPQVTPVPARAVQVTYNVPRSTFSGLKIDQLRVTGEAYKPYKGVRGKSLGKVEWRI
jgi:AP-3 complex subunit mu